MVAPGEILGGKYQAERILGQGGMGLVIAARHLNLDQRVAIKLLNQEHLGQPLIVERFLREARASVRLRSEHVARVLDAGRFEDGTPYLVMEYLEGRDLAAELSEVHHLPVAAAVDFVLQVCEAVAEAHHAGIIHRDLKPANMFVTRDADGAPMIKVLDFGISKVTDDASSDLTHTKMVMGSPPYMSPEQLRMSRGVDPRSDVWSLGVVLYELVSGRRPFVGETLTDLVLRISTDPPEPLAANAPPGLEAAIARCLAKAPADRYANMAELAAAVAPFAGPRGLGRAQRIRRRAPTGTPIESGPPAAGADARTTLSGATGTLDPGAPRSRAAMIGGAAIVAAVIAVIAVAAVWSGGSAGPAGAGPAVPPPAAAAAPAPAVAPPAAPAVAPPTAPAVPRPTAAASPSAVVAPPTAVAAPPAAPARPTPAPGPATAASTPAVGSRPTAAAPSPGVPTAKPLASVPRPPEPRRTVAPSAPSVDPRAAAKPPARRAPPPTAGSAAPAEDLTKSQY